MCNSSIRRIGVEAREGEAEAFRDPSGGLRDRAHAHKPHRLAGDLPTRKAGLFPTTSAQAGIERQDAFRRCQQKRDGVFGHRDRVCTRGHLHRNAPFCRRLDVDIVDPHAMFEDLL